MIQRLWLGYYGRRHHNRKWQISLLIISTSSVPNPYINPLPSTTIPEFRGCLPLGPNRQTSHFIISHHQGGGLTTKGKAWRGRRRNSAPAIGFWGGLSWLARRATNDTARDGEFNIIQAMMSPGSLSCTNNVPARIRVIILGVSSFYNSVSLEDYYWTCQN